VSIVAPGDRVPEFSLARENGSRLTQADIAGQTAVLVFYPFAFSPVCTDQLNLYEEVLDQFAAQGATLYGVSCDSTWTQRAFKEKLGITIEQLSDFEPKGEACRAFGVYHPKGFAQRAIVIVAPDGLIRWSYQAPSPADLPGANLIFDGLAAG
jgi:mycoredoxin-dependent peroxiredoxin